MAQPLRRLIKLTLMPENPITVKLALATASTMPSVTRNLTDYLLAVSFLITAAMLFRVSRTVRLARQRNLTHDSPQFWMVLGGIFVLFAAAKAANVFAFAGLFMRAAAHTDGLYNQRKRANAYAWRSAIPSPKIHSGRSSRN